MGCIPAAIPTVGASALVFVVLRTWPASNEKWTVLEAIRCVEQRARGLFSSVAAMDLLFVSIESVSLTQFTFATLFVLPPVMVCVFVGSRIGSLSDGEQGSHMDATTLFINTSLIVGGIVVSIVSSSVVYYLVRKEIKSLQSNRPITDELDPEAPEDAEQGIPLLAHS